MQFFKYILASLKNLFFGEPKLKAEYIIEMPDKVHPKKIYIAGENGYQWFVAMSCPCGCEETLYMNLDNKARPRWDVEIHDDKSVTLYPSVNRTIGCRSHFYLRKGKIQWCKHNYT